MARERHQVFPDDPYTKGDPIKIHLGPYTDKGEHPLVAIYDSCVNPDPEDPKKLVWKCDFSDRSIPLKKGEELDKSHTTATVGMHTITVFVWDSDQAAAADTPEKKQACKFHAQVVHVQAKAPKE